MSVTEYLGFLAGVFSTLSIIPQIVRVFRLKSAREISILFTVLLGIGSILWLIYGVKLALTPIIFWNAIGIVQVVLLLDAKLKYGR